MYYKRDDSYDKFIVYAIDDMKQYVEFFIDNISNTVTKVFVGRLTSKFNDSISKYDNIE